MANIPENLSYTKEHEWIQIDGEIATIGVTDFAQSSLGDIVFVEFPEVGSTMEKESAFGVVESIKSVSDLYAPLTGEVLEVNESLEETPESINEGPYDAWMVKLKLTNQAEISELLDHSAYAKVCEE